MAGGDDDVGTQDRTDTVNLPGDFIRGGVDKEGLCINAAYKGNVVFERCQIRGAHAHSGGLNGMNGIHTCLNQVGNDAINGAAGVKQNLFIVLLGNSDDPLKARQDKFTEHFRGHEQI